MKDALTYYTLLERGILHELSCEDFLLVEKTDTHFLGAVFDGCSSGMDSHLASGLSGKLLRKVFFQNPPETSHSLDVEAYGFALTQQFFYELVYFRNLLKLELFELLTTMLVLLYDRIHQRAFILVLGDGFYAIDGEVYEIDHNNQPNYPAYHFDRMREQRIEDLLREIGKVQIAEQPADLSIATDGVDKFFPLPSLGGDPPELNTPHLFLAEPPETPEDRNMLPEKARVLKKNHGLAPYDDVAVVRLKTS